jgi:predicted ester cyclase
MTAEDNKIIFRRFVEEVINPGKLDRIDELVDPHFVDHYTPVPERASGIEGLKQGFVALRASFPDLRLSIEDMLSEGDKVSFRVMLHGTHRGNFAGILPTGKAVAWPALGILRILDGKIRERWLQSDVMRLTQQLGAVASVEPPAGSSEGA